MSEVGEPPEGGKPTEVPQPVAGDDRRGPVPVDPEQGQDGRSNGGAEPSPGPNSDSALGSL